MYRRPIKLKENSTEIQMVHTPTTEPRSPYSMAVYTAPPHDMAPLYTTISVLKLPTKLNSNKLNKLPAEATSPYCAAGKGHLEIDV